MRSNFESLASRVAMLACGLAIFSAACGGGSGGGGQGGARSDAGSGGGSAGAKADAGAGGQAGARTDAGAGGSAGATDGGQDVRTDGGAGVDGGGAGGSGAGGQGGGATDGGMAGTAGNNLPLGLPWRAFLPLGMAAPGSGVMMGTTSDLTTNHFDATYLGATATFGNASLNLTGAANASELAYIPVKNNARAVDVTGSYSVSVWTTLANTAGFRTVVSGEGFSVASFYLQKRGDTNAFAYTAPPGDSTVGAGCVVPSGPPPDAGPVPNPITPLPNVQYHLVATRDATTNLAILYVNGVESGRGTCPQGWADTGIVGIGHGIFAGNRGDYVQGSIAELGLIDRVLTPTEVANLYAFGRGGMGNPVPDAGTDSGAADTGAPDTAVTDAGAPDAPADSPPATDATADVATDAASGDGG